MATRTISTKLAIEGEAQFKQSVSACNAELKTMKSALALVESEFRNNANSMEALTAKGSALETMYQKQLEKVTTLETALLNAKQAQEEYASRISAAQDNIERYEQTLEQLKNTAGDTSEEQAECTRELEKWKAELAEAQAGQAAAERGVQSWQRQLNSAKVELNSLSDKVAQNNQYLREAEQSADGCAHSIDQYGKEVKKAGESSAEFAEGTQQSTQDIEQLAAALAAAGVAKTVKEITDELLACAGASGALETAIAKLSTLMVPFDMGKIKAKLMEVAQDTGIAASILTEAAYQARSAGVAAENVVEFVKTATKTSVAGFTDSATAVNVLTTAINAYKLEGSDAERVASMLVKTQDEGKTSVGELAQNMGRVIPVAAAYNVSLENLTTSYALLTKSGTNTAIATTNLTALFNELAKDGSTVADILQEQTGQSFTQLMGSGRDLGQVMTVLLDSVNGDATAFANLWSSTTAGQAALSLVNSGAEEFTRTLSVMENSSGAVERNFQTMADTTEFAQQRMANAAENLRIAIGDQLNPALEKLYATGADAFTWATDFVEENPWVVGAITGLTAALGALAIGAAALAAAPAIIGALNTALTLLSANPIVLVAAAITGLVVAVNTLRGPIDEAEQATQLFAKSLKESKAAYDDLMSSMGEQQSTTVSTAAALKDLLAVEGKSATQKEEIKRLIDQLNEAIPDLNLAYDAEKDALVGVTEAEMDARIARAQAHEEHEAQMDRLAELRIEGAEIAARLADAEAALGETQKENAQELPSYFDVAVDYNNALNEGSTAVDTLSSSVRELTAAQEANAAEIAALEAETEAYAQQQAEAERQTQTMTATVEGLIAEMQELQASYEESYTKAYDSMTAQLGLFQELDGTANTSIDNLIKTLKGQVEYMDTYAENIQKAMEMGVDEGLVQKLSDGSEESAKILASIVEDGKGDIAALNEALAEVEEGKKNFSDTVAQMETDFDKKMAEVVKDLDDAIQEMNLEDDTYQIGQNNIQGLIDGSVSQKAALVEAYAAMGYAALEAYKRAVDQHSPSKEFEKAGRFDIQGIIEGAENEKEKLAAAYAEAARLAMSSYSSTAKEMLADMEQYVVAYEDRYNSAMKGVEAQLGLFRKVDGAPKASIGDLTDTLADQVKYMETYAANIQKAMEMGVDEGLVKKLSDGSEESAQILAAIVQGGEKEIKALNAQFARVEEGKKSFSTTVAEMEMVFSEQMEAVVKDLEDAIKEMGMEELAREAGVNNIQGLIDGMESKRAEAVATAVSIAREAYEAYLRESDQHSPSKKFMKAGSNDIQGLIEGAEAERQNLAETYEAMAQTALASMARHLPSTLDEPQAGAETERHLESITAAAINAISGIVSSGNAAPMSFKFVFPDGTEFASYYLDPLAKFADANGTPILNPIK